MLYRSLKFVFSKILLAKLLSFSPVFAIEENVFSFKGEVPGLRGQSIQHMALRPDGRYIFYSSSGANSWSAIDMLDMVTTIPEAVSVESRIQGIYLEGSDRLIVVTSDGVRYFDVSEPFDPEEEDSEFERDDSDTETQVIDSCIDKNGRIFLLEEGDTDEHLLRYIDNKSESGETEWENIFGALGGNRDVSDEVAPQDLRCAEDYVLVSAVEVEDDGDEYIDFYLAAVPISNPSGASGRFDFPENAGGVLEEDFEDFDLQDFGLDGNGERILLMFNAEADPNERQRDENTLVVSISQDLSSSFTVPMGEDGMALARFLLEGEARFSFFMGKHYFDGDVDADINQLLTLPSASFEFPLPDGVFGEDEDRGEAVSQGLELGGIVGTRWFSSEEDHYVYGLARSSGLVKMTQAAGIFFEEFPGSPEVSSNSPLSFTLLADRDVTYEIRVDESKDEDGTSAGLELSRGSRVAKGRIGKDESEEITLGPDDLGLTKDGTQSLLILARNFPEEEPNLVSRLGVSFQYDPPPEPVKDFQLTFGDQSLHVNFQPGRNSGDIANYIVYFSYIESELDDLPSTLAELSSWGEGRSIPAADGNAINSPAIISGDNFSGKYVISPIENNRSLCVRVQVVDESEQFSSNNPDTECLAPLKTKSLRSALGGANSCSQSASASCFGVIFLFLGLLICLRVKKL